MVTDVSLPGDTTAIEQGVLSGLQVKGDYINFSNAPYNKTCMYNYWGGANTTEAQLQRKSYGQWGSRIAIKGGNIDQYLSILHFFANQTIGSGVIETFYGKDNEFGFLKRLVSGYLINNITQYVDFTKNSSEPAIGTSDAPYTSFDQAFETLSTFTGIKSGVSIILRCKTGNTKPTVHIPNLNCNIFITNWNDNSQEDRVEFDTINSSSSNLVLKNVKAYLVSPDNYTSVTIRENCSISVLNIYTAILNVRETL